VIPRRGIFYLLTCSKWKLSQRAGSSSGSRYETVVHLLLEKGADAIAQGGVAATRMQYIEDVG